MDYNFKKALVESHLVQTKQNKGEVEILVTNISRLAKTKRAVNKNIPDGKKYL